MLGDGPIRMITTGHELTYEDDDKTLGEMQFKDMQVSFTKKFLNRFFLNEELRKDVI